jgi:arylsulfatase
MYWSDDGDLMAVRVRQWKVAFLAQNTESDPKTPLGVWQGEFTRLRAPLLYNLRSDPFERGTESIYYGDWSAHRMFLFVPAQAIVGKVLETFKDSRRVPGLQVSRWATRWRRSRPVQQN